MCVQTYVYVCTSLFINVLCLDCLHERQRYTAALKHQIHAAFNSVCADRQHRSAWGRAKTAILRGKGNFFQASAQSLIKATNTRNTSLSCDIKNTGARPRHQRPRPYESTSKSLNPKGCELTEPTSLEMVDNLQPSCSQCTKLSSPQTAKPAAWRTSSACTRQRRVFDDKTG